MASSANRDRLVLSYVLWGIGFFGVPGLHRLYNGKILTGLIWFFTLGLLGVGQLVDVFFLPGMAEEHQFKTLKAKYGKDALHDLLNEPVVATQVLQQPSREERMVQLLKAAQRRSGEISVTQAVMDTGMGFEETEALLKEMVKSGYVGVDNHPKTGVVVYRFDELLV